MPIPIPIPMPVGHSGPKHHGYQQQQHGEGEGEVKKIYLLQPMSKVSQAPVSQLKGGGFTQTHIHMSAPMVQPQHQQPRARPYSHEGDAGAHEHHNGYDSHRGHSSASKGSDMKVLPIVVIPPIAPMQPINIHHSGGGGGFSTRLGNHAAQDLKTFADYGSSLGASSYRSTRSRLARSRPIYRSSGGGGGDYAMASRGRNSYSPDDYDFSPSSVRSNRLGGPNTSRWAHEQRRARLAAAVRAARSREAQQAEQQVVFDDEPAMDANERTDSRETTSASNRVECCSGSHSQMVESRRQRQFASEEPTRDSLSIDLADLNSLEAQLAGSSRLRSGQWDSLEDYTERDLPLPRLSSRQELNLAQYNRELDLLPPSRPVYSSTRLSGSSGSRRLSLDERELLQDEDEWRFDSIKSVSHKSPTGSNDTVTANQTSVGDSTTKTSTTITITTLPPNLA